MSSNLKAAESSTLREQQKHATRARILNSAMTCLMDLGVARTTTLEVQRRAAVSRGALLHHFPTHAELLCAVVDAIVVRNEEAVLKHLRRKARRSDPVEHAIHTLVDSMREPSFLAELELWVVARTDTELREALVAAERKALRDRMRVLDEIFAPLSAFPAYELVVSTSAEFVRGLAVSGILRSNPQSVKALTQQWIWAVRQLLPLKPPGQ
ncbi:TetR family transcriptional regulator [Comamonas testosteroni]|jgi:AcrR family transcriptional regulator|uniref:TetR family transcriptional regulator n=1 Tax=Comamonas testosteroni TaxID=285 RepID=A0A0L7N2P5_COMTE|nr:MULTISPECIES: TetR/AcrR family transcriptional regulator [Comamonas]KOC28469.1 TetR family transcriptional regulator [Comamonas testosteroni]KWT68818.1 transcriptional regulator, TetR family [Comamonas testosteroni]MDN5506687.1 TetR/AcrR family transcriptional regulator [Comamonas sp.]MDN5539414.1 TetR/AcrR family transcriptional regulator [Comamonas sp.]